MSLSKLLAGRKRESCVWEYFEYIDKEDKSKCLVVGKTNNKCEATLSGRNPRNFVSHQARLHKDTHAEFEIKEKNRESVKQSLKWKMPADFVEPSPLLKDQSLEQCLHRQVVSWSADSNEHKQRVQGVFDMIVCSGYPVTLVDQPAFREIIRTLDNKFSPPGL